VRSGLILVHDFPPFIVFHRWLFAKKSERLSTSENTTGMVRTVRYGGAPGTFPRPPSGPTAETCPVRRSNRVTLRPPYTMSARMAT
jgi:hypothetical protein